MLTREEKITSCHICPNHCFFKVTVEDGKILEVKDFDVHYSGDTNYVDKPIEVS